MSNLIVTDTQASELNTGLVELYELFLDEESEPLCFHPGVDYGLRQLKFYNSKDPSIVNLYTPIPVEMTGMSLQSDGAANRPTITIANVEQVFTASVENATGRFLRFRDLIGKRLVKRTTLEKYLIGGESPSNVEFPKQSFYIDRISDEDYQQVSFELAAPYDLEGVRIPARVIIGKYCAWTYQGFEKSGKGGCAWPLDNEKTYAGTRTAVFFNLFDEPLISSSGLSTSSWTAGSYQQNTYVTHEGFVWRSEVNANNAEPGDATNFWRKARLYSEWQLNQSYIADTTDAYSGDHVKYGDNIWLCKLTHTSSESTLPVYNSRYWERVDYCGKTLDSCKQRFQCQIAGGRPSAVLDTSIELPFGAYPGSAKFR
jgi:lambda family phage minor tail protein L